MVLAFGSQFVALPTETDFWVYHSQAWPGHSPANWRPFVDPVAARKAREIGFVNMPCDSAWLTHTANVTAAITFEATMIILGSFFLLGVKKENKRSTNKN